MDRWGGCLTSRPRALNRQGWGCLVRQARAQAFISNNVYWWSKTIATCTARLAQACFLSLVEQGLRQWDKALSHIDGLVQERCNSSALAMELRLSCTNPSICIIFSYWLRPCSAIVGKIWAHTWRCYICNVFSYWLRPCSAINRNQTLRLITLSPQLTTY